MGEIEPGDDGAESANEDQPRSGLAEAAKGMAEIADQARALREEMRTLREAMSSQRGSDDAVDAGERAAPAEEEPGSEHDQPLPEGLRTVICTLQARGWSDEQVVRYLRRDLSIADARAAVARAWQRL